MNIDCKKVREAGKVCKAAVSSNIHFKDSNCCHLIFRLGNYAVELDCTYNAKDPLKAKNCPRMIRNVKHIFATKALQVNYNKTKRSLTLGGSNTAP